MIHRKFDRSNYKLAERCYRVALHLNVDQEGDRAHYWKFYQLGIDSTDDPFLLFLVWEARTGIPAQTFDRSAAGRSGVLEGGVTDLYL